MTEQKKATPVKINFGGGTVFSNNISTNQITTKYTTEKYEPVFHDNPYSSRDTPLNSVSNSYNFQYPIGSTYGSA